MIAKPTATTTTTARRPQRPRASAAARIVAVTPDVPAPKVKRTRKPATAAATVVSAQPSLKPKPQKTAAQTEWEREERKAKAEHFEKEFERQWLARRLPNAERNAFFLDGFTYRGDFVVRAYKLVIEIDGGVGIGQMNKRQQRAHLQEQALLLLAGKEPQLRMQGGHHNNPKGYRHDRIRDCEAILQGWTTLRFPPDMVTDGTAIDYAERVLHAIAARNKSGGERQRSA